MPKDKKYKIKAKPMPYFEPEGMEKEYRAKPMPYFEPEGMERDYKAKPMPYFEPEGLEDEALEPGAEYLKKAKGGMTKSQKKVGTVMKEFKAGKLKSSSGKKVTNPKQAIAIGLSEAGMSKKKMMGGGMMSDGVSKKGMGVEMKSKGGMVRGQGIAIRGTKFKGIF